MTSEDSSMDMQDGKKHMKFCAYRIADAYEKFLIEIQAKLKPVLSAREYCFLEVLDYLWDLEADFTEIDSAIYILKRHLDSVDYIKLVKYIRYFEVLYCGPERALCIHGNFY